MSSHRILLDVGNTRCKWIVRRDGREARRGADPISSIAGALGDAPPGAEALIASVASQQQNEHLQGLLEGRGCRVWFAESLARLDGLKNSYAQAARLGVDRWLAMLGALQKARGERFCVVDSGSALTIDLVDRQGAHEGGFIIPGFTLMQRALFSDTDRVRFEQACRPSLNPGRSTAQGVSNGILLAQAGAVELALAHGAAGASKRRRFICGGDGEQLRAGLRGRWEWEPDLVMDGLLRQRQLLGR